MAAQRLQEKRAETNQRILAAARSIFAEVGFAGARMDEIAKRAGVNKATIYYHIGDKEALYAQVLHNLFAHAADRFRDNIKAGHSPEQKLKIYIQTFSDLIDRNPEMPSIMLREQAAGGQKFPEIVVEDLTRVVAIITEILEEGTDKGVFIKTSPLLVHFMIIGTIILVKKSAPIRSKYAPLSIPDNLDNSGQEHSTSEIEKLVLNAVSK